LGYVDNINIRKVVPTFNIVEYGIEDVAVHPMKVVTFS